MKLKHLFLAGALVATTAAWGQTSRANLTLVENPADTATVAANLMRTWQSRINNEGLLPSDEAKSWTRRNMSKFANFTSDQVRQAQQATALWEIDLLTQDAPFSGGTNLPFAMAASSGQAYSLDLMSRDTANRAKLGEIATDLVFTPVAPCRIADSRVSQGGPGNLAATTTRTITVDQNATTYVTRPIAGTPQGGRPTSCGLEAIGTTPSNSRGVVLVLNFSSFGQLAAGFVTLFESGTPNPQPTAVSQWYQAGVVTTSTVFVTTDCCTQKDFDIYTSATTDYAIDVVGYFAPSRATALECTNTDGVGTAGTWANGTGVDVTFPTCTTGFSRTGVSCGYSGSAPAGILLQEGSASFGYCRWFNNTGVAQNAARTSLTATSTCCRVPGRIAS